MKRYRILGTTNNVDACECCGREGLKKTVILGALDADGSVMSETFFGTSCAAKATGEKARHATRKAEEAQETIDRARRSMLARAERYRAAAALGRSDLNFWWNQNVRDPEAAGIPTPSLRAEWLARKAEEMEKT